MPVSAFVRKQRLIQLQSQIALRFDGDETRPEFRAILAIVTACYASTTGPPASTGSVLSTTRGIRTFMRKIVSVNASIYYTSTPIDPIGAFVPVDFSGLCPPCPSEKMQHQWNLNGLLRVGDKIDGDFAFGFSGTFNFATFKRRLAGSGGSSTFDIRKNGVSIFSGVPTILAANGNDFPIQIMAFAGPATFVTLDNFTFHLTGVEAGSPADVIAALDVTKTGP